VNVDTLWTLVSEQKRKRIKKGKMPVIDVVRAVCHSFFFFLPYFSFVALVSFCLQGYFKVLGKGLLPKIPVCVRARSFSKDAMRKIKAIGGKCQKLVTKKK
jgi:large subunit ribosomal protein L27Ae